MVVVVMMVVVADGSVVDNGAHKDLRRKQF